MRMITCALSLVGSRLCPDSAVTAFSTSPASPLSHARNLEQHDRSTLRWQKQSSRTAASAAVIATSSSRHREYLEKRPCDGVDNCRRQLFQTFSAFLLNSCVIHPREAAWAATTNPPISSNQPFVYSEEWTGTALPLKKLEEAVETATNGWPMARWPDAILRRPASPVDDRWYGTTTLKQACSLLKTTAINAGAVGLAAQQSGVDARIVYLETPERLSSSIVMVNPHIVQRSMEQDMRVWQEHCLVLPPTFTATVLRDSWVDVEYWDWKGELHTVRLVGEVARAAQHELDHDRGILTLDHVGLEELENDVMRRIEEPGHWDRMQLAYSRAVDARFGETER